MFQCGKLNLTSTSDNENSLTLEFITLMVYTTKIYKFMFIRAVLITIADRIIYRELIQFLIQSFDSKKRLIAGRLDGDSVYSAVQGYSLLHTT